MPAGRFHPDTVGARLGRRARTPGGNGAAIRDDRDERADQDGLGEGALVSLGAAHRRAGGLLPLPPGLLAARHRSETVAADSGGKAASSRKAKQSAKPVSARVGIVT